MNYNQLKDVFNEAKNNGCAVVVEVTIPGQQDTEFIVNRHSSIDNKLEYYKKTYNEQLVHRNCEAIHIVNAFVLKMNQMI